MASKRFWMVDELSSAARMPLPGCTIAFATLLSWSRFIVLLQPLLACCLRRRRLRPERFHARQRLAFEPLEERAARRRDVGEILRDAGVVERRDGVAAARDENELLVPRPRGGMAGGSDGALVERGMLEGAERAVPHERRGIVDGRVDAVDRLRAHVEDHAVRGDRVDAVGAV